MICIATLTTGQWKQNGYVLSKQDGTAVVIDPGEDSDQIVSYVAQNGLRVLGIINTHAHYDHVGSVQELREAHQAKFHLHSGDKKLLSQANFYRTIFGGTRSLQIPPIDVDLADQEIVQLGAFAIRVLSTPGHTEGSVSLLIENSVFTGDLILFGKMGRSDLPGGDPSKLRASVESILRLPDSTILYPGHGRPIRIASLRSKIASEMTS